MQNLEGTSSVVICFNKDGDAIHIRVDLEKYRKLVLSINRLSQIPSDAAYLALALTCKIEIID